MRDDQLRVQVFIDGVCAVDEPISFDDVEALGIAHVERCSEAEKRGQRWRVEITDPDGDVPPIIFGSSPEAMVQPIAVPMEDLVDEIERRFL